MAHIDDAFRVDTLSLSDSVLITQGVLDPSTGAGFEAPEGSVYLRSFGTDSSAYIKVGAGDLDWINLNVPNSQIMSRHNGVVTQTFSVPTTLLVNSNTRTDSNYTYNAGTVTVLSSGDYRVSYDVSLSSSAASLTVSQSGVFKDGLAVPGSLSFTSHTAAANRQTSSGEVVIQCVSGTTIRLTSSRVSGTGNLTTRPNGTRLNIQKIR